MVNMLLSYEAEMSAVDQYSSTPLHRAAFYGRLDNVKRLVKKGVLTSDTKIEMGIRR